LRGVGADVVLDLFVPRVARAFARADAGGPGAAVVARLRARAAPAAVDGARVLGDALARLRGAVAPGKPTAAVFGAQAAAHAALAAGLGPDRTRFARAVRIAAVRHGVVRAVVGVGDRVRARLRDRVVGGVARFGVVGRVGVVGGVERGRGVARVR